MKTRVLAAAAACCLLLPGFANADWDPTRWGMSADDVRRVLPTVTSTPTGNNFSGINESPDNGRTDDGKIRQASTFLYARVDRDNRTYDVRLSFADDRLKGVELALVNATPQTCSASRAALLRRLGTPASGGQGQGGQFDSWRGASGDLVVFIYRNEPEPHCLVLVLPDKTPGAQQLPRSGMSLALRQSRRPRRRHSSRCGLC
jgi:hypothetical protein